MRISTIIDIETGHLSDEQIAFELRREAYFGLTIVEAATEHAPRTEDGDLVIPDFPKSGPSDLVPEDSIIDLRTAIEERRSGTGRDLYKKPFQNDPFLSIEQSAVFSRLMWWSYDSKGHRMEKAINEGRILEIAAYAGSSVLVEAITTLNNDAYDLGRDLRDRDRSNPLRRLLTSPKVPKTVIKLGVIGTDESQQKRTKVTLSNEI